MTDPRQHAHQLIERLDPGEILAVVRFLEFMTLPPVVRAIATAPPDDEPVTVEDRQAIARAEAWFESRGGKGIPMEDVLADFGLTMDDFPLDMERRGV
jgi:hypothetical protein